MNQYWSDENIRVTVTRSYINKHLPPDKQLAIHRPLPYGSLTDDTYGDRIVERSQRLFLILQDIGCCERIFELVDKGLVDDDLPLNQEEIFALELPNASSEKKFLKQQFTYIVRTLKEGSHINYEDDDLIPVSKIPSKGIASSSSKDSFDRVFIGSKEFLRRQISLQADSGIERRNFVAYFWALRKLRHPHLIPVYATYTHKEHGYVLLGPCADLSLKSVLDDPSKVFKQLGKMDQLDLILRWIRCLVGVVAFMHDNGLAHQAIRPSNIFITVKNRIMLGPYGAVGALQDINTDLALDPYRHAAPEQCQRRATWQENDPLRSSLQSGGRTGHRAKRERQFSQSSADPMIRVESSLSNYSDLTARPTRPVSRSVPSQPPKASGPTNSTRPSHSIVTKLMAEHHSTNFTTARQRVLFPSDVFSLSTVIVQLLSLFASIFKSSKKFSNSSLRTHLGKCNHTSGRGGAPADTSFHSNLRQVSTWLDILSDTMSPKQSKRLPSILSKSSNSTKDKRKGSASEALDFEIARYRPVFTHFVELARMGVEKEVAGRFLAADAMSSADDILRPILSSADLCPCEQDPKNLDVLYGISPPQTSRSSGESNLTTRQREILSGKAKSRQFSTTSLGRGFDPSLTPPALTPPASPPQQQPTRSPMSSHTSPGPYAQLLASRYNSSEKIIVQAPPMTAYASRSSMHTSPTSSPERSPIPPIPPIPPKSRARSRPYASYEPVTPAPHSPPNRPLPMLPMPPMTPVTPLEQLHLSEPVYELDAGNSDPGYETQSVRSATPVDMVGSLAKGGKFELDDYHARRAERRRPGRNSEGGESVIIALDDYEWPRPRPRQRERSRGF